MNAAIEVKNLSFAYERRPILRGLNFNVEQGRFLAIAGPNGAGKTTLLNLLCGQLKTDSGNILIDARNIGSYSSKSLARKIAVVRQEFVPAFEFTVAEIIAMARTPYLSRFGFESSDDKRIIAEAMEVTETSQFATRSMAQLSGGERQRVFIARALAQQSPILLLDEPTCFLDFKHQVAIYDLLKDAQLKTKKTIIAVTHDINLAIQYCDRALLLAGENYHLGDVAEVFTRDRIEQAFGVKAFEGRVGNKNFFLPLGKNAKSTDIF